MRLAYKYLLALVLEMKVQTGFCVRSSIFISLFNLPLKEV